MATNGVMVEQDWLGRARREAAAIVANAMPGYRREDYDVVVSLVAIGWLQGTIFASHESLERSEQAFARLRADLA
jgi:hypothetical protein